LIYRGCAAIVHAQTGDNPDLKQWAAKTPPHLQEHLSMAEKLK